MVDVRLLGPVAVRSDTDVSLGGSKQRGLFVLLAASVPPRRSDEQIIQDLWGEAPPTSARNAVQVYVSGLRRVLQPLGLEIVRSGDGYALTGTELEVDSVRFETLVAQGRSALRAGDPERAADLLTSAVGMWSGTPFDGVGSLPAIEQWRGALEGLRQSALADLAAAQLRSGRPDEATRTARVLVADHPYDERGWVALATAEYWSGQAAAALETCARARELLAEELGVDPGPELAELPELILRHEMVDLGRPAGKDEMEGAPTLPPLPPEPDPFVGREHELGAVLDLIGAGTRVVTLTGMGGIGKTTLALALAHRLHAEGRPVLFCELETTTDAATALDRVCGELGADPTDEPAAAIAGGSADVIILDNAEQVVGLGDVLDSLVRRYAAPQFVVTSRVALGVRGEQHVPVLPLEVRTESDEDSGATKLFWIEARRVRPDLTQSTDPDERLAVVQLCELLGGIPLAIGLVASRTRTQTPAQLLRRVEQQQLSVLDATAPGHNTPRQATLRVVIESAVSDLTANARDVLRSASAVDGWLRQETLELAVDQTAEDFVEALDDLALHGLVLLDGSGRVRLLPPVRHFVRATDEADESFRALLPVILERVEELGPRLYGSASADAMTELSQDAAAISTVLNRAATSDAEPDSVEAVARVLLALRRYWLMSSRIPEAQRVCALLEENTHLPELVRARVAVLHGTLDQWIGAPDTLERLESALTKATRLGATTDRLLVSGWCSLAAHAATYQNSEVASRALSSAVASAADSGDPELIALVQDLEGYVAQQTGDYETALRAGLRALEAARESGDAYDLVTQLIGVSETLSDLGRDAEAVSLADEAFERSLGTDLGPQGVVLLMVRAAVQAGAGELAAARGSALEGLRAARVHYPVPRTIADGLRVIAAVEAGHGRDEEAARCHGAAMALRATADLSVDLTGTRLEDMVEAARERLGDESWQVHSARGAADPQGVVDQLLTRSA